MDILHAVTSLITTLGHSTLLSPFYIHFHPKYIFGTSHEGHFASSILRTTQGFGVLHLRGQKTPKRAEIGIDIKMLCESRISRNEALLKRSCPNKSTACPPHQHKRAGRAPIPLAPAPAASGRIQADFKRGGGICKCCFISPAHGGAEDPRARGRNWRAVAVSPEREVQDRLSPGFPATADLSHGTTAGTEPPRAFGTAKRKNDSEFRGCSPKSG